MKSISMEPGHREESFPSRGERKGPKKEEFLAYIKEHIAQGYPVIALGIIGPPEPYIVAGYEAAGDVLMGWNFFQNDSEFASAVSRAANEMMTLIGDWSDIDRMLDNFGDRSVREKISELLDQAKEADIKASDGLNSMNPGLSQSLGQSRIVCFYFLLCQ